jgi:cellulose synthase (UDP-forming)
MNPRKPTFNVTAKGLTLENDHLSELAWPFFVIYGVLFCGALTAAFRYFFEPGISNLMAIVGLWNFFNLLMAGAALGAVAERKQTNRHPRLAVDRRGVLDIEGHSVPVVVSSVSAGDCVLRLAEEAPAEFIEAEGVKARLRIEPIGALASDLTLPVAVTRAPEMDSGVYDCVFEMMQPEEYFVLADLMYGDPGALSKFLESRRKHKSILAGTLQFVWWGLSEPLRAFAYALKRAPGSESASAEQETPQAPVVWLRRLAAKARRQPPQPVPQIKEAPAPSEAKSA